MLMYNISGSDYDSIGVVEYNSIHSIKSMQYYFKDSKILRASNVKFNTKVRGLEICLASIESDDTDTVILPTVYLDKVLAFAVKGLRCKRLIIPANARLEVATDGFCGSDTIKELLSLSRTVTYKQGAFPIDMEVSI